MGLSQPPPPELLAMIASYIMPDDFESLSLTCKQAYDWAKPLIPRHNEYRRRYRNFSFDFSGLTTISDLLAVIADDPIIATYMVHVELDGRYYCEETDMRDADYVERMTKRLSPLVLGSPHLSMLRDDFDEPAELWLEEIVRDLEYYNREIPFAEFGVPFLATLLVNVETLILPEEWCNHRIITNRDSSRHIVTRLLRLLVTRANDKALKDQPLQKLRAILPARNVDLRVGTVMEQLFPFLALDSLKELHHTFGKCAFARGRTAFRTLGRNLEVMKLNHYDICGHSAKVLFKNMHKLRVLEMEYSTRDEVMGKGFQADLFMRSVITGTFASLEKLVFTGRELWPDTDVVECSFREFTRLKYLELSTIFFVNGAGSMSPEDAVSFLRKDTSEESSDEENIADEHVTEDSEDSEDQEETSEEEDDKYMNAQSAKGAIPEGTMRTPRGFRLVKPLLGDQFHPDDKRKMYKSGKRVWRLVSALPESLETLIIHTPAAPRNSACVERMFWRFEELRAQRLPNLKQIEVHVQKKHPVGERIRGYLRQTRRLENFFADKKILTKFEKF
ncbi:F-box domain protein [Beauveria bassiana ARSEF 2860]|uniref:F-box domain protein n=1 Tax=Beauveria bassiana (strain ARSEF 2860) TaxID=655819 RepID=J5JYC8_BEAB2|nr:F-box domain protein [Beauveria bassiana ARSEF 2860]EJP67206.1 F-box domain protein [Beauveria bassiana ARSEF 2860]